MALWVNSDGLTVKFGGDEGDVAKGGWIKTYGGSRSIMFDILAADVRSATVAILGSVGAGYDGSYGIVVPEGARIQGLDIQTVTAFTSTGTIGSATLEIGLIKDSDRSTELDYDGFTTTAFVGSRIDAAGERTFVEIGSTGVGALVGTTLSESGVICVRAAQHATHPLAAGVLRCRLDYFYP